MSTDKIKSLALDTVNEFCEWYFDGPDYDTHNIGDDYFGIWGLNDEFWDFGDIVRAVGCKDLITPEQLTKWYWDNVENKQKINLRTYLRTLK